MTDETRQPDPDGGFDAGPGGQETQHEGEPTPLQKKERWDAWIKAQEEKSTGPMQGQLEDAVMADGRVGPGFQYECNPEPIGCGQKITPVVALEGHGYKWDEPPEDKGIAFRNLLSLREWQISGMCQACQDKIERPDVEAGNV